MRLISFDLLRTLEIAGVRPYRPGQLFRYRREIQSADWVLFPEYWQIGLLAHGWGKRIFPSVASYRFGLDRIALTCALQAACPEHVPATLMVPSTPDGLGQALAGLRFPCVADDGHGAQLIEDEAALRRYAGTRRLLHLQERLPIHRGLRVVHVGDRVVSAYWCAAPGGGGGMAWRTRISFDDVPAAAVRLVERVACGLGVDHAQFDLAEVGGHCYILGLDVCFAAQALSARGIRLGPTILDYLGRAGRPVRYPSAALGRVG